MGISHINEAGYAKMVDVSEKTDTHRKAIARAIIVMNQDTLTRIMSGGIKKGDVLQVAQVAGIMAAKSTSTIIPMCHPLLLTGIDVTFEANTETSELTILGEVSLYGKTGVEMEALTCVSVAALTVYDMCKAIDKTMMIKEIVLLEKTGGKSGTFRRVQDER